MPETSGDVRTAAAILEPALSALLGDRPGVRIEFWDGSAYGPEGDGDAVMRITSPQAMRWIAWAPSELGLARAFVSGDVETEGELAVVLRRLQRSMPDKIRLRPDAVRNLVNATRELGVLGKRPTRPPEEAVPSGVRHSISRDKQVVSHHYDVGNDFYRIVLGPAMTYSCARFPEADFTLEEAQAAKHDLICRKLGLGDAGFRAECAGDRPRVLDVGCGWGSMAIHAAAHHDVEVVGVTVSDEQAALARKRVADAGLVDRVEIRVQDYREVSDGPYDAISSIGMAEHVGKKRMPQYFKTLFGMLRPGGRMMNHAIASVGGSKIGRNSFIGRYVFPDGELLDLGDTVHAMHAARFEVRDVENLREHYAETLRHWVANLEASWDEAIGLVGERRARVWRLYMSGSINGFDDGGLQLYQTLGVKNHSDGTSDMPRTRAAWA